MTTLNPRSQYIRRHKGFSLVEILIGLTIGLIGAIAIFSVFANFEKQKRTTVGRAESQSVGGAALLTLSQDLRLAGYGFADTSFLNCTIQAYDENRPAGARDFTFSFLPLEITQGAAGAADTVRVTYSDSAYLPVGQAFTQPSAASANYKLSNRAGYYAGDLVIATETIAGVPTCTLAEITNVPGTPGQTDVLIHNNGNYTNASGQNISSRFNKPGGLGVTYTTGTLYNLGSLPRSNTYLVENANRLSVRDEFRFVDADADGNNDSVELSDEIIDLQAQYGVDTNNDGVVTVAEFQDAAPANWRLLRSARIAVLVRSRQFEKDLVTTAAPSWAAGSFVMANPDASTDWRNYRYRVYETVVPLRNMIWGQS
jgi:type IV pilus assembly protein PilW